MTDRTPAAPPARRLIESIRRLQFTRVGIQMLADSVAWCVAITLAVYLRYDDPIQIRWRSLAVVIIVTVAIHLATGWLLHLYRGRHPHGSFAEARVLFTTTAIAAVIVGLGVVIAGTLITVPRSTLVIALPFAILLLFGIRYFERIVVEWAYRPLAEAKRTLVYGAGSLGTSVVRRMRTEHESRYAPIGLIDDSDQRKNTWIDGVRVLGTGADLERVVKETQATVLVIAIAAADSALLRSISDSATTAGMSVQVFPSLEEVLEGKSRLRDLRDINIEDLIGRHPVDTEVASIAGYLDGKRVLVTGAGGSIGSELCRQIIKFSPTELIMLDHDETALQSTQISLYGNGLLDTKDTVLASIRDPDVMLKVFKERRPEVVFHAAALKHLPLLEKYPDEAWHSNVIGTLNVLKAALAVGTETFVNISTDKAANPTSVLGHSKRMAERLTAWAAADSGLRYLSVRFGNVIGSRGSMLPTFQALIDAGGPLTVTHPDVTRYFMTIPEACQLVVQAGGIGRAAEVLILDMGEPVRILDVAERMIEMSGRDIAVVFTGLRPGEKLHEELIGDGEDDVRPLHPQISHARAVAIDPESLKKSDWDRVVASKPS